MQTFYAAVVAASKASMEAAECCSVVVYTAAAHAHAVAADVAVTAACASAYQSAALAYSRAACLCGLDDYVLREAFHQASMHAYNAMRLASSHCQ